MIDTVVKSLTIDSRRVQPGDLFIALRGLTVDGHDYITEAIQRGAAAVLVEQLDSPLPRLNKNIPLIPVSNLKKLVGVIAAQFYNDPSRHLSVIGITGTNGKTSISHFIAEILAYCNVLCGVIGTLGIGFLDRLNQTVGTTPDAIMVQKALADLKNKGAKIVAMEVTSHALHQHRVEGVHFHTALFTNLTRDHLDYHPNMEHYAKTKQRLFTDFRPTYSVINVEDEFGRVLARDPRLTNVIGIGDDVQAHNVVLDDTGIHATLDTPWGKRELHSQLLGKFNLNNLLAAIAAVCLEGFPLSQVLESVKFIKTVPGRMMRFGGAQGAPLIVVDYAHTPDALEQILKALRAHCRGKLWCVFGCGGDRDRGKRPQMASIAEKMSDKICLTQDNPRTEDPDQIIQDMVQGLKNQAQAHIEMDRKQAIAWTIQAANADDIVVIAGKGHENYQILGTEKIPYSDQEQVEKALKRRMSS